MKIMKERALDVLENPKNDSIVNRVRGIHKLANKAPVKSNIGASDCEVNQTTNQLTIMSDIR